MCFLAAAPIIAGLTSSLSSVGGIATALGAVASAGGAIAQGRAADKAAQYNAQVAANAAGAERQRAAYDTERVQENVRRTIGAQRAAVGSSGIQVSSGTPVAVLGETVRAGEQDVLARLYSGESASRSYTADAAKFRAEGKAARQSGVLGAAGSLISSVSNLAASSRYRSLA